MAKKVRRNSGWLREERWCSPVALDVLALLDSGLGVNHRLHSGQLITTPAPGRARPARLNQAWGLRFKRRAITAESPVCDWSWRRWYGSKSADPLGASYRSRRVAVTACVLAAAVRSSDAVAYKFCASTCPRGPHPRGWRASEAASAPHVAGGRLPLPPTYETALDKVQTDLPPTGVLPSGAARVDRIPRRFNGRKRVTAGVR